MRYNAIQIEHSKFSQVLVLEKANDGIYFSPLEAISKLKSLRAISKLRIIVDGQMMTLAQAEQWALEEYKFLPKCEECGTILNDNVFTHTLNKNLFCSEKCKENNYLFHLDILEDQEDCDCLF